MKQNLENIINNSKKELDIYIELLKKWQKAVNLISNSTLNDIWNRHVLDSAQLYLYLPEKCKNLIDIGSGAGFPALVLAILNQKNNGPVKQFILVESDTKKCLFLKEVVRILSLPVLIINKRIESIFDLKADVLTARALSSLKQLLIYGKNFITQNTTCLFLKGKNVDQEIQENDISCQIKKIKSVINSDGYIIKITEVFYD